MDYFYIAIYGDSAPDISLRPWGTIVALSWLVHPTLLFQACSIDNLDA